MVSGVGVIYPPPAHSWPMVTRHIRGSGGSYWHQTGSQTYTALYTCTLAIFLLISYVLSVYNLPCVYLDIWCHGHMDAPLKVCDVLVESKVEVSHDDNILYMFYGSFYVICILTYLYSLHKYRPLDHNTNYISQGARSVLIFSSLCLYCPVLYQELSKLNEVCNSKILSRLKFMSRGELRRSISMRRTAVV